MHSLTRARYWVFVILCVVVFETQIAKAAPLVVALSGTGHVHVNNLSLPDEDKTAPIAEGTGSLSAGGSQIDFTSASLTWDIHVDDSSANFATGLHAFGGNAGDGTAEATINFFTPAPVSFRLVVNTTAYGNDTEASVDGNRVAFTYDFMNPEPPGEKQFLGSLFIGPHVFTVKTFASQDRNNPLLSDGTATLTLSSQSSNPNPVPLPPAVYTGTAMIAALAVSLKCGRRLLA